MLLRAPEGWSHGVSAALAMLILAALDPAGSYAAKEAVLRRSAPFAVAGIALFVVLSWIYCSSLQYADLAPITLGWIVALQVGVVLLDRYRYAAHLPAGKGVAGRSTGGRVTLAPEVPARFLGDPIPASLWFPRSPARWAS
jgi:hypothetical protein